MKPSVRILPPSLRISDVLERLVYDILSDVHVALPGIVVKYYADTQTADIQPAVKKHLPGNYDDEDTRETLSIVHRVPVAWPRGGGYYMHMPVAAGDNLMLVFTDHDYTLWRSSGKLSEAAGATRHGLSGAVAIPGLYDAKRPLAPAEGRAEFGREGGPVVSVGESDIQAGGEELVALARGLDAIYAAIAGAVPASGAPDSGAALKASIISRLNLSADWAGRSATVLKGG